MEELHVPFSCRDVLAACVDGAGGTQLVFDNVSEDENFLQIHLSFSIPHPPGAGLMVAIAVVGHPAATDDDAKENACVSAVRVLQEQHGYIVLDYSIFRVWECRERYDFFIEKMVNCKDSLANCLAQSLAGFRRIESAVRYFGSKINTLVAVGADVHMHNVASSCATQLDMIYNHAMEGHRARADQFDEINDTEDLNSFMLAAGFSVPDNLDDRIHLDGAIEVILSRVASVLGYHPPEFELINEELIFKWLIRFVSSGTGRGTTFTAFGKVSYDTTTARHSALYRSLLACSVNYKVVIADVNRDAYLFCKDRFSDIASDLSVLGNIGTGICSSIESVIRSLDHMIGVYSALFSRHRMGRMLLQKLKSLSSDLVDCVNTIGPLVVTINQEAFLAQLPY